MASSTEDKVRQIIVEQLGVDEAEVTRRRRSSTTSAPIARHGGTGDGS
jgi:acyl carrier protein